MNFKKRTWVVPCAVISTLAITVSSLPLRALNPAIVSDVKANERTIQGVWRTVVTPRNCQTGDAILTLSGLFTFNQGGTMSEYGIGPGSSPALRSPGHGVWQREHGWQDYSFAFTYYRYNASGVFLGSQKVRLHWNSARAAMSLPPLGHRDSRCQRQRDRHRLRHRRWDALRISLPAPSSGTAASVSISATASWPVADSFTESKAAQASALSG